MRLSGGGRSSRARIGRDRNGSADGRLHPLLQPGRYRASARIRPGPRSAPRMRRRGWAALPLRTSGRPASALNQHGEAARGGGRRPSLSSMIPASRLAAAAAGQACSRRPVAGSSAQVASMAVARARAASTGLVIIAEGLGRRSPAWPAGARPGRRRRRSRRSRSAPLRVQPAADLRPSPGAPGAAQASPLALVSRRVERFFAQPEARPEDVCRSPAAAPDRADRRDRPPKQGRQHARRSAPAAGFRPTKSAVTAQREQPRRDAPGQGAGSGVTRAAALPGTSSASRSRRATRSPRPPPRCAGRHQRQAGHPRRWGPRPARLVAQALDHADPGRLR